MPCHSPSPDTALSHTFYTPISGLHCNDRPRMEGTYCSRRFPMPPYCFPGTFPVRTLCKSDRRGGCSCLNHMEGTLPSWLLNNDQRGSLCNCLRCCSPSWSVFSLRSMRRIVSLRYRTRCLPGTPSMSSWRPRLDMCLLCMACSDRCWFLQPRGLRVCPQDTRCTVTRPLHRGQS